MGTPLLLLLSLAAPGEVDFVRDIRPLLADRCFKCHGPDAAARRADLRLDSRSAALAAGVIVPGDPAASPLVMRLHAGPDEVMPPPESKLTLSDAEREVLVRWIEGGAEYETHWAWNAPAEPALPAPDGWSRDPLDHFVLDSLVRGGRVPAVEVDRATWARRTSFALTGLPPTPEELDAFLADDGEGAYGREVDRLLASPRFGERMAADWLDVARYADTYGYQSDVYREVWPWRDWVIRSFNEGLPYDQFVTWQVAGDLLPEPTTDQRLATAFNRLHRQTNEGGSVEEEFRVEYVSDRVHTFGTAFLGLTLECARCHDHKYDPITQREYYGLAAFFGSIDESGLYSHFTNAVPTPTVELPTEEQRALLDELGWSTPAPVEGQRATDESFAAWRSTLDPAAPLPGLQGRFLMDEAEGSELHATVEGRKPGSMSGANKRVEGQSGGGLELTGDDPVTFPDVGWFRRWDPFTIGLWLRPAREQDRFVIYHRSRAWHDSGSRGYQLLLEDGRPSFSLIHFWPGDAVRLVGAEPLPVGEWSHVTVTHDGSGRAAGLTLFVNGEPVETETVRDALTRTIVGSGEGAFTIGERFRDKGFAGGGIDDLAVIYRELAPAEVRSLVIGPEALSAASDEELRDVFEARAGCEPTEEQRKLVYDRRKRRGEARDAVRQVMAMRELGTPRATHVLHRGQYDQPREQVDAHTPRVLPALTSSSTPDRLDLARWLFEPDHPLTSRVAVNRLWQVVFGRGLVGTTENFGVQGAPPTHPELLDHLATSFVGSGWDVKGMLRRLVLSSTFRQASGHDPDDPENDLLGRGASPRLSAEMLRDQALLTSGLLVERLGGPSVKPYQPPGLWKEKSGRTYTADTGDGLYRRSLYTIWKRTSPPPAMMILDAAKRDVCVARRRATQSPLQALLLWNDPQYVEAGRALAERTLEGQGSDSERLAEVFRRLTSRPASEAEIEALGALLGDLRADYTAHPEDAIAALSVGVRPVPEGVDPTELASWSLLATTLLSHHAVTTLR